MDDLMGGFEAASISEFTVGPSSLESQEAQVPLSFKLPRFAEYEGYTPREIPRYLFRVSSKHSSGDTTESWVKSPAALKYEGTPGKLKSILEMSWETKPARMLYKHLEWEPFNETESADNLMSWTSSILFALVYIYRHHAYNRLPWSDIRLCIIDTAKFPEDTFICDLDLLDHFEDRDQDLMRFHKLRNSQYYFGEYLSQGALHVEGKCKVLNARTLKNAGFLQTHDPSAIKRLREGFKPRAWGLAKPIVALRKVLLGSIVTRLNDERLRAIVRVADLFGLSWRLPVALNLVSMLRYLDAPERLLDGFKMFSTAITEQEWEDCEPSKTNIATHDQLVEVEELKANTNRLWQIFPCAKLQEDLQQVSASLEAAKTRSLQLATNDKDKAAFWHAKTEAIRIMISLSKGIQDEL